MARVQTIGPRFAHDTDADFRAWIAEIHSMLAAAGLVQTTDTGQINVAAAVRPAPGGAPAGYSMWRFNDPLQTVQPIFIRIGFGTAGGAANRPLFAVQVGQGSDGSNSLTGLTTPVLTAAQGGAARPTNDTGEYVSYATHSNGFAALVYKPFGSTASASSASPTHFCVQRTVNNQGLPTAEGVVLLAPSASAGITSPGQMCRLRFEPTPDTTGLLPAGAFGMVPGAASDSRVGLSPQLFPHWVMLPQMRPLGGTVATLRNELSFGQQFGAAIVGLSQKNYLHVGAVFGTTLHAGTNSLSSPAVYCDTSIVWEE